MIHDIQYFEAKSGMYIILSSSQKRYMLIVLYEYIDGKYRIKLWAGVQVYWVVFTLNGILHHIFAD